MVALLTHRFSLCYAICTGLIVKENIPTYIKVTLKSLFSNTISRAAVKGATGVHIMTKLSVGSPDNEYLSHTGLVCAAALMLLLVAAGTCDRSSVVSSRMLLSLSARCVITVSTCPVGLGFTQLLYCVTIQIEPFIHTHNLDTNEILMPLNQFKSFNQFFYRELKPSARPIDAPNDPTVAVSVAVGALLALIVDVFKKLIIHDICRRTAD